MAARDKLQQAFHLFDQANALDPHKEVYMGKTYPRELLYAMRMTQKLNQFAPDASDALQLTARCQHICRWEIPRESYEMNRIGYLRWRGDLRVFHARKAAVILGEVGFDQPIIDKVIFLLEKKQLKKNPDTQTLEDVICLVFLEHYLQDFAEKHPEDKTIDILRKTWRKMSGKGQAAALELPLSQKSHILVARAVEKDGV